MIHGPSNVKLIIELSSRLNWNVTKIDIIFGAWGSVVVKALRYKLEGPGIDSRRWRLEFILWALTFLDSKNEYQNIPGSKGGRCVGVTTLPPSCAESLEPCRPHRPVVGIWFVFTLLLLLFRYYILTKQLGSDVTFILVWKKEYYSCSEYTRHCVCVLRVGIIMYLNACDVAFWSAQSLCLTRYRISDLGGALFASRCISRRFPSCMVLL